MKVHYGFIPHWIGEIIQYDSFCQAVRDVWSEVYPSKLSEIYDYIDDELLPLGEAWKNDGKRWNDAPTQTAQLRADRIKNALRRNIEWFNQHIPVSPYASIPITSTSCVEEPIKVFNLQGILIGEFRNIADAKSSLRHGVYIINGEKMIVR